MSEKTLIAAFGNILRGDDGFGLAVLRQLADEGLPDHVELYEVGTGGIRLAQQLLDGYDRLIVIDAMTEGGEPGALYVRRVEGVKSAAEIDMHTAVPSRALAIASALDSLPAEVYLVGCEPAVTEELVMELTPVVRAAVPKAVRAVLDLAGLRNGATAGDLVRRMDEVLELLYWMEGEGFATGSARLDSMVRFLAQPQDAVVAALERLRARGDVTELDGEYRLTDVGRKEAARRFAEEFAPMLSQGHGECSDPDCDCQSEGPASCRGHQHQHQHDDPA